VVSLAPNSSNRLCSSGTRARQPSLSLSHDPVCSSLVRSQPPTVCGRAYAYTYTYTHAHVYTHSHAHAYTHAHVGLR
jgi:hypothetical protein